MLTVPRTTVVVATLALLAACSTTSLPITEMKPAPADRVSWTSRPDDSSEIVIARDAGAAGLALWAHVSIDGVAAAQLDQGEFVRLKVAPGVHTVVAHARGLLNPDGSRPSSVDVVVEAGRPAPLLRIGFSDRAQMSLWRDPSGKGTP